MHCTRTFIEREKHVRRQMVAVFTKWVDPQRNFTARDAKEFNALGRASQAETIRIKQKIAYMVKRSVKHS